ncbi:hypothetical protein GALMADRAFT_248293 [Galerina marginata CBS 339.88]|uniref:Uncharacterized protein n=1 Tax=Galerina marginata (strain CBS 339.88) TaxID=685588 RepID=A0A067T6Y0_GALM3|nr:hypothetical protein GALMADRAFT_248293 [Galerina marginata CBS 339.88]
MLEASLSENTLYRTIQWESNTSWQRFLSHLLPQRFEWISPDGQDVHLVGVCPMLRSLFTSWTTLSSIHLEGICLVGQPNLTTWNISLLAERVHIQGYFADTQSIVLVGLQKTKDSTVCRLLTFENSSVPDNYPKDFVFEDVLVLAYGNTMVTLKNWSRKSRRNGPPSISDWTAIAISCNVCKCFGRVTEPTKTPCHLLHTGIHDRLTLLRTSWPFARIRTQLTGYLSSPHVRNNERNQTLPHLLASLP